MGFRAQGGSDVMFSGVSTLHFNPRAVMNAPWSEYKITRVYIGDCGLWGYSTGTSADMGES